MKRAFVVALAMTVSPLVLAQSGGMKGMNMKEEQSAATHKANGTVTKVDPAKGSITIAHGPVPSLQWPPMTMAFKAKDKAMLEKVKPGDKVEFSFVHSGRGYVVTELR